MRARARRRRVAAAAVLCATAIASLTSGCQRTSGLSKQEVVVVFKDNATQADHARVYHECQGIDGVDPEPLVTKSKYVATMLNNVRYRVDHASNYELQQLYNCLAKDPSVKGYKPPAEIGE